jgi:hypothetical protein
MSIKIHNSVLIRFFANYSSVRDCFDIINANHTLYYLTSFCGKEGLCIPYDYQTVTLDDPLVELFYIYEILTMEEMLTHESKEVRFLGILASKKEAVCEI